MANATVIAQFGDETVKAQAVQVLRSDLRGAANAERDYHEGTVVSHLAKSLPRY